MKDPQIRQLLKHTELSKYNDGHSKIVHELRLPVAKARIDIAVLNGHMHGYEIKSAADTLIRLPSQIEAYAKVFDFVTVVTEDKYVKKLSFLPEYVGISICIDESTLVVERPALPNTEREGFYIAKLLWRHELTVLLEKFEIAFCKLDRNWLLCEALAKNVNVDNLSDEVREVIKKRVDWK